MRIKLYEEHSEEKIYHGTSYENAMNIIENGLTEQTYWGSEDNAKDYAYSYDRPVLIEIPISEISAIIEPNHTLINYYEENQEEDDNVYEKWLKSEQGAFSSLEIFDSVILPPTHINIDESNLLHL